MRYSQKMKVNGTYLEDLIPGYQTLEVTGREDVDMDISSMKISRVDGERYQHKRKKARTLKVKYMIRGMGPDDFASKYDRLKAAMKVSEAQLVFDDDPGKYWVGTPAAVNADFPGQSVSTGTIEITCHDPNKYGLVEKTVDFVNGTAEIYYSGTEEAYPNFHAEVPSKNGFVSFTKGEDTLLFGDDTDPGDDESPAAPDPDALIEQTFDTSVPSGTNWAVNEEFTGSDSHLVGGTLGISAAPAGLYPTAFSTNNKKWHGPTIVRHLSGSKTECTLNFSHCFEVTANAQCGAFRAALASATGEVAAISYYKTGTGTKNGEYALVIGGAVKKAVSCSYNAGNTISGTGGGVSSIAKVGSTFTFTVSGNVYQFTDESLEDVAVTRICFYFAQWNATTAANKNRLFSFRFTSPDEGGGGTVIEHAFHAGDVLDVDCSSADTKLNNVTNHALGNVRNPWESMKLSPGLNIITLDASDWATSDPTARVTYREVFA